MYLLGRLASFEGRGVVADWVGGGCLVRWLIIDYCIAIGNSTVEYICMLYMAGDDINIILTYYFDEVGVSKTEDRNNLWHIWWSKFDVSYLERGYTATILIVQWYDIVIFQLS